MPVCQISVMVKREMLAIVECAVFAGGHAVEYRAMSDINEQKTYKTSDFDFDLPTELIAQYPLEERPASRLLCLDKTTGAISHRHFYDIVQLIKPDDLLVLNDTRVIPARLAAKKATGGQVEILLERIVDDHRVLAHIRASKSPKPGSELCLPGGVNVVMQARHGEIFELAFPADVSILEYFQQHGKMPLPPYIERAAEHADEERYQTVFSERHGAVAAPTAGLHFDEALLAAIEQKGVETAKITLHVGAGTFQPMRVENLDDHVMHKEYLEVDQPVCDAIERCRARGGRVIAVGTTVVRALESAAGKPFKGETQLFITPGFSFHSVDAMITNFHLPKSTLLMLVAAFAGYENILKAYQVAVVERYRFFSYGDAMWLGPSS